jgi:glycolate oxidase subunit GlcD
VDKLLENLRAIVSREAVLAEPDELLVYECDGLPQHKYRPRAVVFPSSTEETAAVMRVLAKERVPFVPRGAGTGLSGGALALNDGVVIELARMRKILKIDTENRLAIVQTGVVNSHVSKAVADLGLHYVPDPSSQPVCTIGGNIAENAGGIHCLKYGVTTDHVLGATVVLSNGDVVNLGGGGAALPGYDLLGTFIGSEGTFGIATEATLRLVPIPPAVRTLLADFPELDDASRAVSAIIAAGVIPAALEMMDQEIICAVEASSLAAGLPTDAGAALLIELDGLEAGIDDEAERLKQICLSEGARSCRLARDENERKKLWAARKGAFGAISRIAPDAMIQDAVVPRSRLPEVLSDACRIAAKYQLRLANVFHAGDGNLHPLICFDSRSADQVLRVKEAGRELMETCVRAGGSISGEHGVGFDKREYFPLIFSEDDMEVMLRVRAAFDPLGILNPGKIIPTPRGCGEGRAVARESEPGADRGPHAGSPRGMVDATGPVLAHSSVRSAASKEFEGDASVTQSLSALRSGFARVSAIPDTLAAPHSVQEVSGLMRLAAKERWSVIPSGAGTWLDVGNPLHSSDLIISTKNLNRILEHEPADLIATAEAGVTLDQFNAELAKRGQWLPLDPPDDCRATIGGVIATGMSGALKTGYGSPRSYVIGMKIVLADATLVKAGGRVVKNVAGYDLCKLFTGSYGTLGLITEATFKLRPLPETIQTVLAFGSSESLIAGGRAIVDAKLFPAAVELFSPPLAAKAEFNDGKESLLLIRFAGSRKAVSYQCTTAIQLLGSHSRAVGPLDEDDTKVWRDVAALPLLLKEKCIWRASVKPADLANLLDRFDGKASSDSRMWQASVAEGRVRVIESEQIDSEQLVVTIERIRNEAQSLGGSLIIESASVEIKRRIDAWGDLANRAELMRRIKQQLDPQNLFSPARLIE